MKFISIMNIPKFDVNRCVNNEYVDSLKLNMTKRILPPIQIIPSYYSFERTLFFCSWYSLKKFALLFLSINFDYWIDRYWL